MKLKYYLLISFLLFFAPGYAQLYKLSGIIVNDRKEPLPLASVEIKELKKGSVSKDDGSYQFFLERGKYDIVVSMVGYKTKLTTVYINNEDVIENINLQDVESSSLSEVIIRVKVKDKAEEIIRNVIKSKDAVLNAPGSYSCNIYIKAFQQDSLAKRKKEGADSSIKDNYQEMALAEISLQVDKNEKGQIKEERVGVNKRGNTEGLFYQSSTEGDFNIYNSQLKVPAVSEIPFVSPISYSGLVAYRFKTLNIDRTGKRKIYTIAIRPRLLSNATIEGELTIEDSSWAVLKASYRLPPAHMPEFDYFEVNQVYENVNDSARMITRQQFNYYTKIKGGRRYGETTALYFGYELNKQFKKGYFGNELSITTTKAYQKDSVFWNNVRKEPLSVQQKLYVKYQDSIYKYMHSEAYLDSVDRALNKITWPKMLVFGQIFNDHNKERMWIVPPITSIIQPIAFGGARLKLAAAYRKTFKNRKNISIEGDISYGFRNKDINGTIGFKRKYNPFNQASYGIKVGRNFDFIYAGDAWINVLKRSNIYLNNSIEVSHVADIFNGLRILNRFEVALRRSVSDYKVGNNADSIFGISNEPPVEFDPYNATYNEVKLLYTPKQKYLREPLEKIILGSKWPTFFVAWKKGVPKMFNSDIDFDYLEAGLQQELNLGVAGNTSYNIKTGKFVNTKDLRIIDYKFMRQGDPLFFQNPQKAFQALDSTFPVFDQFLQANLLHEFNGFFINRIPFMKKLKLQEVAGGGLLITKERSLRYVEFFTGIERVFKWPFNPLARVKLGIYIVGSIANKFNNPVQFKIGLTTWDRFKNTWR